MWLDIGDPTRGGVFETAGAALAVLYVNYLIFFLALGTVFAFHGLVLAEILATLYQIGFERSHPKPDPRPNRFGERVAEVYRGGFVQREFGSPGGRPA
jgi:hypothetical protein